MLPSSDHEDAAVYIQTYVKGIEYVGYRPWATTRSKRSEGYLLLMQIRYELLLALPLLLFLKTLSLVLQLLVDHLE